MTYRILDRCFIDGAWVAPSEPTPFDLVNPVTERVSGTITMGGSLDVDRAVAAARKAFAGYARLPLSDRIDLLTAIAARIEERQRDLIDAIMLEIGAPRWLATEAHAQLPIHHLRTAIDKLAAFPFERPLGKTMVLLEPIGVCGLITPWNWPASVVMTKVVPALATGCTMVLKPSEYAPYSAMVLAECVHDAGTPAGVFNMVFGDGPTVGAAISAHSDIDLVSFTGSTRAGIEIARAAAPSVKRVHQELGGKSPNILLPSADVEKAVAAGMRGLMVNSGQTCSAPSRMLVPRARLADVKAAIVSAGSEISVGDPESNAFVGTVANRAQFERVQTMIEAGISEGATVLTGGPGRPEGLNTGYYVRPTVFADTTPDMKIVREEIFGPVLVIQDYEDIDDAIGKAIDTDYGLAAYLQGADIEELREVAAQIPAGQVYLNGSGLDLIDLAAPFGGFKRSGNGREWGEFGFEAFLEMKALVGYQP